MSIGKFEVSFSLFYEFLWGMGEALHPCDSCPCASGEGGSILWQYCPQTRRVAGHAEAMPNFLKVVLKKNLLFSSTLLTDYRDENSNFEKKEET